MASGTRRALVVPRARCWRRPCWSRPVIGASTGITAKKMNKTIAKKTNITLLADQRCRDAEGHLSDSPGTLRVGQGT